MDDRDELLTTRAAAQLLGVSVSWLAKARLKGRGPVAVYLPPRMVRYRRSELLQYIDQHTFRSTSERSAPRHRRPIATPTLAR